MRVWLTIAIPPRLMGDEGWWIVEFGVSADNRIRHEISNILIVLHDSGINENLKRCGTQKDSCPFVARPLLNGLSKIHPFPHSVPSST